MKTCLNWRKLALPGLLLMAVACTYAPEEEYFKDIPQIEPVVSISLNSYDDADTIYLWSDASFGYSLDAGKGNLERVEVLMNNTVVQTNSGTSGQFSLKQYGENYEWFRTGTFELKLQFVTSSGSGSLAEKLGAEKLQVWRKWVLVIDADRPEPPRITLSEENGFLKISWSKYTKPNFVRYVVSRTDDLGYGDSRVILDPEQNSWIDSTYVGGYQRSPNYGVYVESTLGYTSGSSATQYDPITYTASPLDPRDSTVTVTWTGCKYPNALGAYVIRENGLEIFRTTDVNVTSATVKLKSVIFGTEDILYFDAIPKYVPNYYFSGKVVARLMLGSKLPRPGTWAFNIERNQYIAYSAPYGKTPYFYLCTPDLAPVDSFRTVGGTPHVPVRGHYIYYSTYTGYGMIDLDTKATVKTGGLSATSGNFKATSNGLVNYDHSFRSAGKTIYGTVVYDLLNDFKTVYSDGQYYSVGSAVSGDGNFIWTEPLHKILKVSGGTTTLVGSVGNYGQFIGFRGDDCNEMIFRNGSVITIRSSSTLGIIRSLDVPFGGRFSYSGYDPASKYMVWENEETHTIGLLHIETGATKTFKSFSTQLVNGVLFFGEYYIKVV